MPNTRLGTTSKGVLMIEFELPWKNIEDDETEIFQGCNDNFESLIRDTHPYDIFPNDLEKRIRVMVDLLNNPKSNQKYNINQAIALSNSCIHAHRQDLAQIIQDALGRS